MTGTCAAGCPPMMHGEHEPLLHHSPTQHSSVEARSQLKLPAPSHSVTHCLFSLHLPLQHSDGCAQVSPIFRSVHAGTSG
jgi:hypothetical protein